MLNIKDRFKLLPAVLLFSLAIQSGTAKDNEEKVYFKWDTLPSLPPAGGQPNAIGAAGAITGIHNGALIIAGGRDFEGTYGKNENPWHDDIWVMELDTKRGDSWMNAGKLAHSLAYSAVVSTGVGLVAMGGRDGKRTFDEVWLLVWDRGKGTVRQEALPPLPGPCCHGSAGMIGNTIYLAGGTEGTGGAMKNFWKLDLSKYGTDSFAWETLPAWPGPERAFNMTLAQHNGYSDCIYVMGGCRQGAGPDDWEVLKDVYEFSPGHLKSSQTGPWRKRTDMPSPRVAGTGAAVGQSHIFVLSGSDVCLHMDGDSLIEKHPGFPDKVLAYHTITDTWFGAGELPANDASMHSSMWNDQIIIASGEIEPQTGSPQIWKATPVRTAVSFGWFNTGAVLVYLMILVAIGVFFSFRNKSTEDFFRGGQRVPWWAAGCSIFATMLSSLTFMSIPAKTYATDWLYFFLNMAIIALAPFIIHFILPFFRRIDATSAYQYLELRFNLATRLFASASYILFQVGRMAIVMFLPSLALSTVTSIPIELSILIMGLWSIIYCTLGGVEAVIWTDTLQTFVLLGGALLSMMLVIFSPDIGISEFFSVAAADHKFRMADWGWNYATAVCWVVVMGGIGQALIPYSSDQGVVQRYMSVSSKRKAAQSIWTNAGLSFFATVLFFGVGTALYVYYKKNPTALDPTYQTDAVFPLFIAHQLPVGIAGIVVAGIFAAAQSTVSTSMNSISTAITTDFVRRFELIGSERGYLKLARLLTVVSGLLGTGFALVIAYADIKSLWDSFISILGLLGGAMCGLFMLGMFTQRANGTGALIGAILGALGLWLVQQYSDVSFLLYASIGIAATFVSGYLASLLVPGDQKPAEGLTIHTLKKGAAGKV